MHHKVTMQFAIPRSRQLTYSSAFGSACTSIQVWTLSTSLGLAKASRSQALACQHGVSNLSHCWRHHSIWTCKDTRNYQSTHWYEIWLLIVCGFIGGPEHYWLYQSTLSLCEDAYLQKARLLNESDGLPILQNTWNCLEISLAYVWAAWWF